MTKITNEEYLQDVETHLKYLADLHANEVKVDVETCILNLEYRRSANKKVRDFVVKNFKIKGEDFDRALRSDAFKKEYGRIPATPQDLVAIIADKKAITAQYNGKLYMNEMPYLEDNQGRRHIPPDKWHDYEYRAIMSKFHRDINFDEFAREVRITADEYGLPFSIHALNDASDKWYETICRDRLYEIVVTIDFTDNMMIRERGQASLLKLAQTCFDCDLGPEFVVAVFKKFIWQVKRKIGGLPIFDHLMMVILGLQGTGKSTLICKLLDVISELWVPGDFKQITDDRNIQLWRNYVIFMDEMGWASKSDMDTVKNIITAKSLSRRVMRSNNFNVVSQNATFIGAANADELAELIRDETGARRFVALTMKADVNREVINSINWQEVWQSVDEQADDPMRAFQTVLKARQEADRAKSVVEHWMLSLDAKEEDPRKAYAGARDVVAGHRYSALELHNDFREYEKNHFPRSQTSIVDFSRKLSVLCQKKDSLFEKTVLHGKGVYVWLGGKKKPHDDRFHLVDTETEGG